MTRRDELIQEIDSLISILDEDINLSCQRVTFMREGKPQKARFIDEKIRPSVHKRLDKQVKAAQRFLNENGYGKNN